MGDHYQMLGLRRNASKADIKNAFFRLAHRHHPDHHAGANDAARAESARLFRQAKEAYEVLSDDRRRAVYDFDLRRSSASSSSSSSSAGRNGHGSNSSSSSSSSSGRHEQRGNPSSSSNNHGSRHGHGGSSRSRPPLIGGGRVDKLIWFCVIAIGILCRHREEKPDKERMENTWGTWPKYEEKKEKEKVENSWWTWPKYEEKKEKVKVENTWVCPTCEEKKEKEKMKKTWWTWSK